MIFYDRDQAWHLNADVKLLPDHRNTGITIDAGKRQRPLLAVPHTTQLWVPGRDPLPLGMQYPPYTFTMPYADEQKAAFVVALPSLVRSYPGGEQFPKLDEFFLGVTAHELVHTRQLPDVVRRIDRMRTRYPSMPEDIDDNFIQKQWKDDAEYARQSGDERRLLLEAVVAKGDAALSRGLIEKALAQADARRKRYFSGDKAYQAELDDIFLVMEGIGVWVQFQVARDLAGKEESWQDSLKNLLSRNDDWVQEEGLALFLLIDRLVPNWQARFLAPDFPPPFEVLRDALRKGRQPFWRRDAEMIGQQNGQCVRGAAQAGEIARVGGIERRRTRERFGGDLLDPRQNRIAQVGQIRLIGAVHERQQLAFHQPRQRRRPRVNDARLRGRPAPSHVVRAIHEQLAVADDVIDRRAQLVFEGACVDHDVLDDLDSGRFLARMVSIFSSSRGKSIGLTS